MDDLGTAAATSSLWMPSAGSTFKRPKGYFAAALIDECKLKGVKMGGARCPQARGLPHQRGATCDDVLRLAEFVRDRAGRPAWNWSLRCGRWGLSVSAALRRMEG